MAFDYGVRSIGVAFGTRITGTGEELKPLNARDGIPNWQDIEALLKNWRPAICLVGNPLNMDDSESEFCVRCRKFANRLHGRFGVQVELVDERLSTRAAKDEAKIRGMGNNFKESPVDSIAARLILESWFNR